MSDHAASLRVVELAEGLAGPVCGRLFAGLGHEVVKLESPIGDSLRHRAPLAPDGRSLAFEYVNRDKSSLVSPKLDADDLDELLGDADILILDLEASEAEPRGLAAAAVRAQWPRLVTVSITGFGQSGEYAGTVGDSLLAESYGGLATMIGQPGQRPLSLGGEQTAYCAALTGWFGAMLAIGRRNRGADGDFIDVAMCDVAAFMDWKSVVNAGIEDHAPRRMLGDVGTRLIRAADGWVGAILQDKHWPALIEMVGAPELEDPELARASAREVRADEWWPYLEAWIAERSAEEVYDIAQARGIPFGWARSVADVVRSPQLRSRHFILQGDVGKAPRLGFPAQSERLCWRSGDAPTLGSHAGEPAWGHPHAGADEKCSVASAEMSATGGAGAPLAGFVVLDFGTITAGAAVSRLLADYGATVIKIESPSAPDPFRAWKVLDTEGAPKTSPYFASNNLGKYSVSLDLKREEAREVLYELVRGADVVVENFRVGVTSRLGIDYEQLREINPDLLYLSLSSQGLHGPEAGITSYGSTLDLLSGLGGLTGYAADAPIWSSNHVNYPDQIASLFGAALIAHCLTMGITGTHLDASQQEMVTWTLGAEIADFVTNGHIARPSGNRRVSASPHDIYPAAEPDTWVAISCTSGDHRLALARAVEGLSAYGSDGSAWVRGQDAIDAVIASWTRTRSREQCVEQLRSAGVPAVPVLDALDRTDRARFAERGVLLRRDGVWLKGYPMLMREFTPMSPMKAPALGHDTKEVLMSRAGVDEDRVRALQEDGVLLCSEHLPDGSEIGSR